MEEAVLHNTQEFEMIILPPEVSIDVPDEHKEEYAILMLYKDSDGYSYLVCDKDRNTLCSIPMLEHCAEIREESHGEENGSKLW